MPIEYNYLALIQGGIGPDVWDKEMQISAADFRDAASQAMARAEELGGQLVQLDQNDWGEQIQDSLTAVLRTLARLNERVHNGYDFNADKDMMAAEVGMTLNRHNTELSDSRGGCSLK